MAADPLDRIIIHVDPELSAIVPGFMDRRIDDVDSMRAAIQRRDFALIRNLGHQMKGAGSSYGFDGITETGQSLETAAAAEDVPRIRELLAGLVSYLKRVDLVYSDPGEPA